VLFKHAYLNKDKTDEDDLQSDKIWSPTTPAVKDLQKSTGKEESALGFRNFWGKSGERVNREITGGETTELRDYRRRDHIIERLQAVRRRNRENRLENRRNRETALRFRNFWEKSEIGKKNTIYMSGK